MKKALKILRKIFFWIFFVGLFLTTVLTVIFYIYEDEIKQFAIDELNEHLNTEVQVGDIELSLFKNFPSASIEFKNVFIADSYKNLASNDTLFHAKSMFFNFNIMAIYSGDYKVNRISLHDGGLHMKTTQDGEVNYDILKEPEVESESNNFEFVLELLEVENFDFAYKNLASQQFYDLEIHNGLFQGNFSEDNFELVSEASIAIHRLKSNSFTLVKDKKAELNLELSISSLAGSYEFKRGDLTIEEMPFQITGLIDSSNIDLTISGNNIELSDLANSLVDESFSEVKKYEGKGIINFNSHIQGPRSVVYMPSIDAKFDIENGSITETESDLTISDVNFIGTYQNAQIDREEEMKFEQVEMKMLNSYFKGAAVVTNFVQPTVKTVMEGNLNLGRFHQFFKFENIEKLAGNVNFHLQGVVQFLDPEFSKERFDVIQSDGTLLLDKVQYKGSRDPISYQEISGEIVLNDKDAAANNLKVRTQKSDLLVNGAMKNLMPFLDGSGNLGLIASVESNFIDLNEFIGEPQQESNSALTVFELPSNVNLNIDLELKNLKWEEHKFTNITSKVLMSNRQVNLNQLNFNMLEGSVRGNLLFKNMLQDGNIIDGNLVFKNVNVNSLFKEWNNFDQKSITHENLYGKTSGDIDLLLCFNPYFSLIEDKLYSKCNINISNGRLDNMETMRAITDYMRSNKALKLLLNKHIDQFEEKLLHLKFSDLQNEITIQNRKLIIPKMKIVSNALDVELFGWHDFDNQIEYHFSFRFRELKTKVEENEFGIIEDDGLGIVIYLSMYGDLDNPEYSMDGNERRKNFKQDLVEEKQDIKSMLKTELGFFKKDTTVKKIENQNRNEVQFIFYDDEQEQQKDSVLTDEKKNKKRSSEIFDRWKQEADKRKEKIEIEHD